MLNFQCRQPNRTTVAHTLNLALFLGHLIYVMVKLSMCDFFFFFFFSFGVTVIEDLKLQYYKFQ